MKNLLRETIDVLGEHGKSVADIKWIGCEKFKIPFVNFVSVADVEYDSGYGSQEVAIDLIICGEDFWLERHEYDGSEWWEYKEMPKEPKEEVVIDRIIGGWYSSLSGLNKIVEV